MKPLPNTEITRSNDFARVGDRVVRQFASIPCPHCLRARLRASSMREVGEGEYALTCSGCHRDILTITYS
jgi:hypothetical protein